MRWVKRRDFLRGARPDEEWGEKEYRSSHPSSKRVGGRGELSLEQEYYSPSHICTNSQNIVRKNLDR